jgi:hypothetical protein
MHTNVVVDDRVERFAANEVLLSVVTLHRGTVLIATSGLLPL